MNQPRNLSAFKWVMGGHYFLYFGTLGIYLPYFNLYCHDIGFNGFQIGTVSALRSFSLVCFPILWSIAADRYQVRRPIFIACAFVSSIIWSGYLYTRDYEAILWLTALYGVFFAPVISFMEAFTMDVLGQAKRNYGRIRAWGTVAFILVSAAMGMIIDRFSVGVIISIILSGLLIQAGLSLFLPQIKIQTPAFKTNGAGFLKERRSVLFLLCAFLMLLCHGTYYGFFSIHLESIGISKTVIGLLWALASLAEILVMIGSDRIFSRFRLDHVMIFSFMAAALRWIILSRTNALWSIILSQCLHAFTYATFHIASILYMDRLAPARSKTLGQSVNNALTYGLGMMTGFFLNGWLYERIGSFHLFGVSSGIALSGGVILLMGRIGEGPEPETDGDG